MFCPCGTNKNFDDCCGPYLSGEKIPETAEALMRSRYTAFTRADLVYIEKTLAPESREDFDIEANKEWAEKATWKKLNVLKTEKGTATDKKGTVEFVATYSQDGQGIDHHEVAHFRKNDRGEWLFCESHSHTHKEGEGHHHHHEKPATVVREAPKVGRNDPCICGSGKKFKKCCG
ncbi:MAG: YchJ family protein [Bdellovibrionales bacterium]